MNKYYLLVTILMLFGQPAWAENNYDELSIVPLVTGFEVGNAANRIKVSGEFSLCGLPEVTVSTINKETIEATCITDVSEDHDQFLCIVPVPYPNFAMLSQNDKIPTRDKSIPVLYSILIDNKNISVDIGLSDSEREGGFVMLEDAGVTRETLFNVEFQDLKLTALGDSIEMSVAHELTHTVQQGSGNEDHTVKVGAIFNIKFPCAGM